MQKIICSVIGSIAEDNLLSDRLNYRRLFAQLLAKLQKIIVQLLAKLQKIICSVIGSIKKDFFAQRLSQLQKIICYVICSIKEEYLLSDWLNYKICFA